MNTVKKQISDADKARLWLRAWHELHSKMELDISREDINEVFANLPQRLPDERLSDWLQRKKYIVEADFMRMAASSGNDLLALPPGDLETDRFRLTIEEKENELELRVQAIGLAIDEFANTAFVLCDAQTATEITRISLDYKGFARVSIADTQQVRKALLHPKLCRLL